MAKKIATLAIAIEAQTAELKKGFQETTREVRGLGDRMQGAFVGAQLAATALLEIVESVADAVRAMFGFFTESVDIARFAQELGVSRAEAEAFVLAFAQMGVDTEQAIDLMKEFEVKLGEAREGTGEGAEALERLGVSMNDLQRNSPIENFRQVAAAIGAMEQEAARFTAGQAFAGVGEDFVSEIQRFDEEFQSAQQTVSEFGIADLDVEQLQQIQREWAKIAFSVRQIITDIGNDLLPTIRDFLAFTKELSQNWQAIADRISSAGTWLSTFVAAPSQAVGGFSGSLAGGQSLSRAVAEGTAQGFGRMIDGLDALINTVAGMPKVVENRIP